MAVVLDFKDVLKKHVSDILETEIDYQEQEMREGSGLFLTNFFSQLLNFVERLSPTTARVTFKGGHRLNRAQATRKLTEKWKRRKAQTPSENPASRLWQGTSGSLIDVLIDLADKTEGELLEAFGGVKREVSKSGDSVFRKGVRRLKNGSLRDDKKNSFVSWEQAFKATERKRANKVARSFGNASAEQGIRSLGNKNSFRAIYEGLAGITTTLTALPDLDKLKKHLTNDIIAAELQQAGILGSSKEDDANIFHYLKANNQKSGGTRYVNHQLLERAFLQGVTNPAGFQGVSLNRYIN